MSVKLHPFALGIIFCTLASAMNAQADIIVMKSGQRVEGEVLKVQKDVVFVDVGVDVIRIPVAQIQERISQEPAKEVAKTTDSGVFMTADLPERSELPTPNS